jgi:hypothetical protein
LRWNLNLLKISIILLLLFENTIQIASADQGLSHTGGRPNYVSPLYDEQAGFTFDQNFTAITAYIVATPLSDPGGFGAGLFLNGLTDKGWWYQVGVAYDWPNQDFSSAIPGFSFVYDAFEPSGESVVSSFNNGTPNLTAFLPQVRAGDIVMLSISINGSNIHLKALDLRTGLYAEATYNSSGATKFVGLREVSNQMGYFTGVMTEWYRTNSSIISLSEGQADYWLGETVNQGTLWADEYLLQNFTTIHYSSSGLLNLTSQAMVKFSLGPLFVLADSVHVITGSLELTASITAPPLTLQYVLPSVPGLVTGDSYNITTKMQGQVWGGISPYTYSMFVDGRLRHSGVLNSSPPANTNFTLDVPLGVLKPGNHTFYLKILDSENNTYTTPTFLLTVLKPSMNISHLVCGPYKSLGYISIVVPTIVQTGNQIIVIENSSSPGILSYYRLNVSEYIIGNPFIFPGVSSMTTKNYNNIFPIFSCQVNAVIPTNSSAAYVYLGYGIWFDTKSGQMFLEPNIASTLSFFPIEIYFVSLLSVLVASIIAIRFKRSNR